MMKRFIAATALAVWLSLAACEKHQETIAKEDHLIVSTFSEGCLEEAEQGYNYKITPQALYEDTNWYPHPTPQSFSFIQQPVQAHRSMLPLLQQLPAQLLAQPSGSIGTPTMGQHRIYLEHHQNGQTKTWTIQAHGSILPPYLRTYVEDILHRIDQLN